MLIHLYCFWMFLYSSYSCHINKHVKTVINNVSIASIYEYKLLGMCEHSKQSNVRLDSTRLDNSNSKLSNIRIFECFELHPKTVGEKTEIPENLKKASKNP